MRVRCVFTVGTVISRSAAISALVRPRSICWTTRCSVGVSVSMPNVGRPRGPRRALGERGGFAERQPRSLVPCGRLLGAEPVYDVCRQAAGEPPAIAAPITFAGRGSGETRRPRHRSGGERHRGHGLQRVDLQEGEAGAGGDVQGGERGLVGVAQAIHRQRDASAVTATLAPGRGAGSVIVASASATPRSAADVSSHRSRWANVAASDPVAWRRWNGDCAASTAASAARGAPSTSPVTTRCAHLANSRWAADRRWHRPLAEHRHGPLGNRRFVTIDGHPGGHLRPHPRDQLPRRLRAGNLRTASSRSPARCSATARPGRPPSCRGRSGRDGQLRARHAARSSSH